MKHSVPLQEEIIMEILSRLPVRSLLRFKCVSKCWMTLISEPYFTLKHRNRAKNDQNSQKFLVSRKDLLEDEFSLYCSSLSLVQRIEEVQKLDCPSNGKPWRRCKLYFCYDSLVIIGVFNYRDKTNRLLLWNPSTRESIVLPDQKFSLERCWCTWGLGYDSVSDNYKILKIDLESYSEILALKSGSWRLTNNYPIGNRPDLLCTESFVFVHGAFHWIDNITRSTVTALSISSEVYTEILLPEKILDLRPQVRAACFSFTEKLCVYVNYTSQVGNNFRFWVMKDYGVTESWAELFTIPGPGFLSVIPKYRFSDGIVLLCYRNRGLRTVLRTSKAPLELRPQSDFSQTGVHNYPDKDFMLLSWNPSTRESVVLPNPKFSQEVTCTWGLGYDSTSDDYKILKIDGKERNEILALKSSSWRKIDDHPATDNPVLSDMDYLAFQHKALDCVNTPSNMGYLAFVHGAFHWVDSLLNQSVVTFSISDEVY
ncbi:hypothetical protein CQW23_13106 [Capsicum baccatum]|uniref:F-box domain-containing protein n=1 Tax=Capsicum baccatum TaxID=33114 RepID=A0A2G2WUG3_CAPBA|nr:hypothetical protein CQW23_13106 [Capsicum baccatum]